MCVYCELRRVHTGLQRSGDNLLELVLSCPVEILGSDSGVATGHFTLWLILVAPFGTSPA